MITLGTWCNRAGEEVLTQLPLYLLGQDASERWTFALDISDAKDTFVEFLRNSCGLGSVSLQVCARRWGPDGDGAHGCHGC